VKSGGGLIAGSWELTINKKGSPKFKNINAEKYVKKKYVVTRK